MQFTPETLDKFKTLCQVNQSVALMPGNKISSKKIGNGVVVYMDIDEEIPEPMNIYDFKEFLGLLDMIPDSTIDLSDPKFIRISGQDQSVKYFQAEEYMVKESKAPNSVKFGEGDVSFEISLEQYSIMMKSFSIFSSSTIAFEGDGKNIFITRQSDESSSTSNEYKLKLCGYTGKKFKSILLKDNIKLLRKGSYTVTINKVGISRFVSDEALYYIVLEQNSTFEGNEDE